MATRSLDVVILGGGNAGMGVTVATREAGLKVAMIDAPQRALSREQLLQATRVHEDIFDRSMPKKVLVAAAHALDEIERARQPRLGQVPPSRSGSHRRTDLTIAAQARAGSERTADHSDGARRRLRVYPASRGALTSNAVQS
jgi:pyruvate/2-oxoglutarate dehydrogenase complex dihydrolipoamide dehydrogenase (E3) component